MRTHWILLSLVAAIGCRSSEPPAASPTPKSSADSAKAVASDAPETSPPSATDGSASPPASALPAKTHAPVDPALRELVARLLETDDGVRRINDAAALELEKASPTAATLLPLFEDPQADVRRGAAFHVLAAFDRHDADQVSAFLGLLEDDDPTVRGFAVAAVRQMRPQDQRAAVPQLTALLAPDREARPESRAAIARLLGSFQAEGAQSLDRLAEAAHDDPDATVRAAALSALPQVAEPERAATLLAGGLGDPEPRVRIVAVTRLRQLGAEAAPAARALSAALADDDQRICEAAAEALIRIGEPAALPLAEQLAGKNGEARKLALACLAKIGPPAKAALPAVKKCQADADPIVRELAAVATQRIAPK